MNYLITGSTGFIGSELVRRLSQDKSNKLFLLIRPKYDLAPQDRFRRIVEYWNKFIDFTQEQCSRIEIIPGDLGDRKLNLKDLSLDYVFHAAAETNLGVSLAEARRANVYSLQVFLHKCRELSALRRFVHFSTAFVCGKNRRAGERLREEDRGTVFFNHYEQSKKEAEEIISHSDLPFTILRPSIVIGDSRTGYVLNFRVLYSVFRMWLSGYVPRAPLDPKSRVDIVPIDYLVSAAVFLGQKKEAQGLIINLCAGMKSVSPIVIKDMAFEVFGLKPPPLVPPLIAVLLTKKPFSYLAHYELKQVLEVMKWHIPYLGSRGGFFDTSRAEALLAGSGIVCPDFREYGRNIFRFCLDTNWGKMAITKPPKERH